MPQPDDRTRECRGSDCCAPEGILKPNGLGVPDATAYRSCISHSSNNGLSLSGKWPGGGHYESHHVCLSGFMLEGGVPRNRLYTRFFTYALEVLSKIAKEI